MWGKSEKCGMLTMAWLWHGCLWPLPNAAIRCKTALKCQDRTDWHYVILWRKLAEVVEKYVHKGDKLYIEGRIRYTSFNDKQGVKHNVTEIWADNMEMLTPKSASSAKANGVDTAKTPTTNASQTQDAETDGLPF